MCDRHVVGIESQAYLRRKARELDKSQMEQRKKGQVEADERHAKKVEPNEKQQ